MPASYSSIEAKHSRQLETSTTHVQQQRDVKMLVGAWLLHQHQQYPVKWQPALRVLQESKALLNANGRSVDKGSNDSTISAHLIYVSVKLCLIEKLRLGIVSILPVPHGHAQQSQ